MLLEAEYLNCSSSSEYFLQHTYFTTILCVEAHAYPTSGIITARMAFNYTLCRIKGVPEKSNKPPREKIITSNTCGEREKEAARRSLFASKLILSVRDARIPDAAPRAISTCSKGDFYSRRV